jgi:hypothetical protein
MLIRGCINRLTAWREIAYEPDLSQPSGSIRVYWRRRFTDPPDTQKLQFA